MKIKFTKMQAYGKDYVYIDAINQKIDNVNELAKYVSDRHFGIGSDGMVLICSSDQGDFKMRMFNPDGTEGEMCGNALRIMSKYVYEHGLTNKEELNIETLGGIQKVKLFVEKGKVVNIEANIGQPILNTEKIFESEIDVSHIINKNRITKLKDILKNVEYELIKGKIDNIEISDIKYDSRKVQENDMYVARIGTTSDSHTFIPDAIKQGAKVIVIEKDIDVVENVTVIKVKSSKQALAYMSAVYFNHPAKELTTIGITGTAGKTSTTYMLKAMLEKADKKVGLIGTICALIGERKIELHNTTPESYEIQKMFREMVDEGCKYAVMEVSSQGLKMNRVDGFTFDYGVFTNISPEHIGPNEHESFEEYLYCKSLLFKKCKKGIINVDTDRWQDVIKEHTCEIIKYGVNSSEVDIKASDIDFIMEDDFLGMGFSISGKIKSDFKVSIPGRFSVYNSLCAITVAHELGVSVQEMKKALENIKVIGRMELVSGNETYKLIVDYAHNEDEMNNLMDTISEYHPKRLVCIFGGGGNRAKARRYDMGEVAGKWSDLIILTEDNPRWEELESINNDIIVGINKSNGKYIIIDDRKEAIKYAMKNAQKGDIILLIGKGHEQYQEIKGVKYFWDERQAVKEVEEELKNKK